MQGDACDLPFGDGEFDIVHSNAVIEHVGGRRRQEAFVREAVRVGTRVFLTTPNRWFPLEVHTHLPFVHWLPDAAAGRAYDLVRKPWAKENHLLGPGDLRSLFPGPVREGVVAATWVPEDEDPVMVHAALDCPSGWSHDLPGRPMVLGRMTARVDALPTPGEDHVVLGWRVAEEGRKVSTASALYAASGDVLAVAQQTWIVLNP